MKRSIVTILLVLNSLVVFSQENYTSAVGITIENDLFFQTDYYYSAGESIAFINPAISKSPFSRLLISISNLNTAVFDGASINHRIYTPQDTPNAGLKLNDRPYAATLYLSQFKVVENKVKGYRLTTQISIGVIGSNAQGYSLQSGIHSIFPSEEPVGWEYQIENDVLINYFIKYDKSVFSKTYLEWLVSGAANIGTVNNDVAFSTTLRAGIMNVFADSFSPKKNDSRIKTWMELSYESKFVAYNALLQGGMNNSSSVNTFNNDEVERLIHKFGLSYYFQYSSHRLEININKISPEFNKGLWHGWVGINYLYWF